MPFVKKSRRLLFMGLLFVALIGLWMPPKTAAQDDIDLRITAVDLTGFPTVRLRLLARQPGSLPATDLSTVVVREARTLIADRTLSAEPAGIDLAIVLDANPSLLSVDGSDETTRLDIVTAALDDFGRQWMAPDGLDSVSIIIPDETGQAATMLLDNARQPQEINAALAAYDPVPPFATPLQSMLDLALDHLAPQEDGRFQAVLLLTDGARLDRQLDYPALVEKANAASIPIFVGLLGATADANELANIEGVLTPTGGQYAHIPLPEAAAPLWAGLQTMGRQPVVEYQSLLREPGDYLVSVNLGNSGDSTEFSLDLQAPQLTLDMAETTLTRSGDSADTPLPLLQPAVTSLTAEVTWPDGRPRQLTDLRFLVNGRNQPLPDGLAPDENGRLALSWDVSNLDSGAYELQLEARDELGYSLATDPVVVTVQIDRPPAPVAAPVVATVAPVAAPATTTEGSNRQLLWLGLGGLGFLLLAGLLGRWLMVRRRAAAATSEEEVSIPPRPAPQGPRRQPLLLRLAVDGKESERISLGESDLTVGRNPDYAQLVLDDPTVAELHARVRRNSAGQYWLYDEGSASGTFLDHQRLGLAPREMADGDAIHFGRVAFRFVLEPILEQPPAKLPQPETAVTPVEENVNSG